MNKLINVEKIDNWLYKGKEFILVNEYNNKNSNVEDTLP